MPRNKHQNSTQKRRLESKELPEQGLTTTDCGRFILCPMLSSTSK